MEWRGSNMGLQESLLNQLNPVGRLPKKQKLAANTPLQIFMHTLIEEDKKKKMAMLQQMSGQGGMPQLGPTSSPMVEPPSVNPLENALMSMQGGGQSTPQGGMPNGIR